VAAGAGRRGNPYRGGWWRCAGCCLRAGERLRGGWGVADGVRYANGGPWHGLIVSIQLMRIGWALASVVQACGAPSSSARISAIRGSMMYMRRPPSRSNGCALTAWPTCLSAWPPELMAPPRTFPSTGPSICR
jgi:hypothetical protein